MTRLTVDQPTDLSKVSSARALPLTSQAKALKKVLRGVTAESCPRVYNFHMHTLHSDGKLKPGELMEQAVEIGLKGMAITDHHNLEGYWAADAWIQNVRWSKGNRVRLPRLWTGVEINASLCRAEVHILGYGFEPEAVSLRPYMKRRVSKGSLHHADAVVRAIQEAGGLAILAHPARYRRPLPELIQAAADCGMDGVESYYAYNNPSPWKTSPKQTEEVFALAQEHCLLSSCGTDTHGKSLLQRI